MTSTSLLQVDVAMQPVNVFDAVLVNYFMHQSPGFDERVAVIIHYICYCRFERFCVADEAVLFGKN